MRKLFISLYVLIFVFFVLFGAAFDRVWQYLAPPSPITAESLSILTVTLEQQTVDAALLAELSTRFPAVKFELWLKDDIALPPFNAQKRVSFKNEQGQTIHYIPLNHQQAYLTIIEPYRPWLNYKTLLSFCFYMLFAAVVWLWLRPLWRDLSQLQNTANKVAKGDFLAQADLAKRSAIYPIANTFDVMVKRIAQLIQSHKELTSAVSHEIKTPLARAKFAIEMLNQKIEKQDQSSALHYSKSITEDLNQVDDLVSEMLNYAKFEQTEPNLNLSLISANDLIVSRVAKFKDYHEGIHFCCDIPLNITLHCDIHFIDRALQNLLVNAIKYCDKNIIVSCYFDQQIVIAIEDDGCGISDEEKALVLQPFSRLDQSRAKTSGGFGLGLAIVNKIMQWHEGSVRVAAPKTLSGARFELRFASA